MIAEGKLSCFLDLPGKGFGRQIPLLAKDDGILNYSERNYPQFLSLVKVVGMRISARES